jgi:hypothetical protein
MGPGIEALLSAGCCERLLQSDWLWLMNCRFGPIGDLRLKGSSLGSRTSMYPYEALRGPTYRENSHANHTSGPHSHQTAWLKTRKRRPCITRTVARSDPCWLRPRALRRADPTVIVAAMIALGRQFI